MNTPRGVPLTKDEVSLLIDLVEGNKAITTKATNSTNNQLKEVAWSKITDAFNASVSSCSRRTGQLKLKWENLKKSARKRSTNMNNIKTGGGKPDYIPPNDGLDRVASILGATCSGYSVAFGGDSEVTDLGDQQIVVVGGGDERECGSGDGILIGDVDVPRGEDQQLGQPATTPKQKKCFFSTPSGNSFAKRKRKMLDEDVSVRTARNQAIADYYNLKKRKLELEIEHLELRNKKLELEQNK